jgi:hypothetical protein
LNSKQELKRFKVQEMSILSLVQSSRTQGQLLLMVILSVCLFSGMASAQEEDAAHPAAQAPAASLPQPSGSTQKADAGKKGSKRTTINFEDQLIEGKTQKPELFYLLQKKQFNYKRLIRLREDFLPEMRRSGEEIQHKGSGQ